MLRAVPSDRRSGTQWLLLGLHEANETVVALIKGLLRAAAILFRSAYVVAFPADRCAVGQFLLMFPAELLADALHEPPDSPNPATAALHEGALLYEVAGEPFSDVDCG